MFKFAFTMTMSATVLGIIFILVKLVTSTAWWKEWWYDFTGGKKNKSKD